MTRPELVHEHNPDTDLVLERVIDVPLDLVWRAWTEPDRLMRWFTPAPWATVGCDIDLRPGGVFRNTMRSPEGQEFTYTGCYLEVVDHARVVWTLALTPGFRPATPGHGAPVFTAVISMQAEGRGTRYSARAMHRDNADRNQHETMGFHDGWGAALEQLVAAFGHGKV